MKKNKILIPIFIVFVAILLTLRARSVANTTATLSNVQDYSDKLFSQLYAKDEILNQGVTIEAKVSESDDGKGSIVFAVFNHTDEPIILKDQSFGVRLFQFDDNFQIWNEINLNYPPKLENIIIPKKIEEWDIYLFTNVRVITANNLMSYPSGRLRLYTSSTGQETGNLYGSFIDITLP